MENNTQKSNLSFLETRTLTVGFILAKIVTVLLYVTAFIVVGNVLWGFPWKGCTYIME